MADAPVSPPDRTSSRTLDAATRARLLAMLHDELTRASRESQARGMSPQALIAQLDKRIALLRAQITEISADDS